MGSRLRKFIGIAGTVLILGQSAGQTALADEISTSTGSDSATNHHCHHESACTQTATPASINLDLSSTAASVVFSGGHNAATVNIDVAGASQAVNAGQMLTPAQAVAAYQVMHGGVQNILLGTDGSAVGGSMVIGSHLANMLNSLVIPTGVTVVDRTSTLNLAGDLTNSGTLLAVSTNPAITAATVSAANILNGQSGLLTTILPDGGLASLGLSNYSNLVSNLSLNLNAINNIINSGIISSAGNLNMTAGGSIQNIAASPSALAPIMQAAGTLSMLAPQITNAGMIQSLYGNINVLSSIASPNINIIGTNSTMEALNGSINLRDALYTGSGNIDIFGGDYLSKELNLYSGSGAVNVTAGLVTGVLSTYAEASHIVADTPTLVIGNSCIIGDPLWANTGDLQISGLLNTGTATAIIAGGSIIGDNSASISTAGGNLWLIAGANITNISGTPTGSPITNGAPSLTSATFQFDNTHGGNIDFSNNAGGFVLNTSGTTGGNIYLLANSNATDNGNIWFSVPSIIRTNGTAGAAGSVLIAAGGNGGTAQSGPITQAILGPGLIQAAGTTNSGTVTMVTGAPTITNGGGVATFTDSGTTSTTATFGYNTPTTAAQMTTYGITTVGYGGVGGIDAIAPTAGGNGGAITLVSGGDLLVGGNLLSYGGGGGGGTFASGGGGGAGGNAGAISITSGGGSIQVNAEINASGGGGGGGNGNAGGAGGSKADILLSAPASSVTVYGDIFSYDGGAGGNISSLVQPSGGGGSFGGGGGGSSAMDNGNNGGAGGGAGAAGGGGGGVTAGGSYSSGSGGGFAGGGAGGVGPLSSGQAGSASGDLSYGSGYNGGTGGDSFGGTGGAGGVPSGSGNTQLAGGGAGTNGGDNGSAAGDGSTTGGTLTVNYFSTTLLQAQVVGTSTLNQTVPLTSLDLADTTVQSSIGTLIGAGLLGLSGTQTLGTYTSVAVASNVPTNVVTLGSLTALNVPNTYTLTFTGFTNSSPAITVNLTNSSTTTQVLIAGTTSFTNNNNSVGVLNVTTTVAPTPTALVISGVGTLTSDNTLTITTPTIQNNAVLSAGNTLNVTANSGNIFGTGTYRAPNVNLTATGNITQDGSSAGDTLLVNNGGSGLLLYASGNNVNLKDTQNETVSLIGNSNNEPIFGSTSFTLNTVGSIFSTAVTLGTSGTGFTFTSYDGTTSQSFTGTSFSNNTGIVSINIGGDVYSFDFNSGSIPNGASITFVNSGSTFVVVNNTGSTINSANTLVTALNSYFQNGSTLYAPPQIQTPIASITSTSGNIGGNSSASTPLIINNVASGLSLYANGNIVNIRDNKAEDITLANDSNILLATISFRLEASDGSIFASSLGNMAISSAQIALVATGNIGGDSTASSALKIASGTGLSLFASGTVVNLSDSIPETVTLANGSSPLSGTTSFILSTTGNIIANTTGNTAIASPSILLTSTGSIGANSGATSPLLVNSGGTSGLSLFARGTTVNLSNTNSETVTLIGGSTALAGSTSFTVRAVGNIIAGASVASPSGTSFVFTSYSGTESQIFNGGSFTTTSGIISVIIGGRTYSFDAASILPIPNGGTITFSAPPTSNTFVLVNNTGSTLTNASSTTTALNSYFQNGSAIYSTPRVQSPAVSLTSTNGNIGGNATATTALRVSSGAAGLSLFASGAVVNLIDSAGEGVTLANNTSPLNGSTSFSLNANASILASVAGNTAITSPSISLTVAALGIIAGNIAATSPLLVNSGGTSGLSIYATGNKVNLQDANSEAVTLANGTSSLNGNASFVLTAAGNILAATASNTAITSPITSLTSTSGNIGGNALATSALLINSGSTSGLSLFASGATVNLRDANSEDVTLANSTSASAGTTSFTLNTVGNIVASTSGSIAVTSSIISLTSTTGNVGASSTALKIANPSSSLSLFVSGNIINLNDTDSSEIILANSSGPLIGATSFQLGTTHSLGAAATTAAIRSPIIDLSALSISTDGLSGTTPLTIERGTTPGALLLSASAGFVYLQDISGDTITLNSSTVDSTFSLANSGDITVAQNISAFGSDARVDLKSSGTITNDATIEANGLSNTDGLIQFSSLSGNAPLTVVNNGTIQTSNANSSSIIGFNSGTSLTIDLTGSGSVTGDTINFGNLNPTTLAIQAPFVTVASPVTTYTKDNISIQQTGGVTGSLIQVSGAAPVPPTPSGSGSSSSTSPFAAFFTFLQYQSLLQQQLLQQQALLNEQLGTRIATEYTPPVNVYNLEFPLQGNIQVEQLAAMGQALFSASTFTKEQLDTLAAQGIVFGPKTGGSFFDLNKGDVVFMPTSDIQVQTKEGIVTIPKGAIVFVMETGNDAAVYDMHDSVNNPVKLLVNNKELTLSPGKQVLLTRDGKASFEALNPGGNIGTRNVQEKDMGQGIKAYTADFTISGGMSNVQVIRSMLKSNNPEHVKAANKMLKNAAILSDLGGYKTPYKTKQ